jgi:protein FrlC
MADKPNKEKSIRFGAVTSLFVNYSLEDAVQQIAKAGFHAIDIWGGRPHVYRDDFSRTQLIEIRRKIEDKGMEISSFMPTFYRYPTNLCSPNPVVRKDSLEYVFKCMDNAAILGAATLLVVPSKLINGDNEQEAWKRMSEALSLICEKSKQYSLNIGLEVVNHLNFSLINSSLDVLRMINQFDFPNLGIVLDTGHINLEGEKSEVALNNCKDKLLQIHINDNNGLTQQNTIPGDGTFNFQSFFSQLIKINYQGVISIELLAAEYTQDPAPFIRLALNRVHEMMGKCGFFAK